MEKIKCLGSKEIKIGDKGVLNYGIHTIAYDFKKGQEVVVTDIYDSYDRIYISVDLVEDPEHGICDLSGHEIDWY